MNQGSTPPPVLGTGDPSGTDADPSGPFDPRYGQQQAGAPQFMEPTVLVGKKREKGRSRWVAPIAMIAAGIVGATVFGALSLKKAHDDLVAAEEARDALATQIRQLETTRDRAVARAEAADEQIGQLSDQLVEARRTAKKAKKVVAQTSEKADALEKKLRSLASETSSEVERDGDRLTLKLVDKVLFRSGESELTKRGKRYLKKVGAALKKADDKQIWVQGHTDNVPVARSNSRFDSNWELSAARALSVVYFLEGEVGISGKRLAAVAFSKYRPVSRKIKSKNRRIEIVLAPRALELVD